MFMKFSLKILLAFTLFFIPFFVFAFVNPFQTSTTFLETDESATPTITTIVHNPNPYPKECPEFDKYSIGDPFITTTEDFRVGREDLPSTIWYKWYLDPTKSKANVTYDYTVSADNKDLRVLTKSEEMFFELWDIFTKTVQQRNGFSYTGRKETRVTPYKYIDSNTNSDCLFDFELLDYRVVLLRFKSYKMNVHVGALGNIYGNPVSQAEATINISDNFFKKMVGQLDEEIKSKGAIRTQVSELQEKIERDSISFPNQTDI